MQQTEHLDLLHAEGFYCFNADFIPEILLNPYFCKACLQKIAKVERPERADDGPINPFNAWKDPGNAVM